MFRIAFLLTLVACATDPADVPAADIQHDHLTCQHGHSMGRWIDHEQGVVCYDPKSSGVFSCVPMTKGESDGDL